MRRERKEKRDEGGCLLDTPPPLQGTSHVHAEASPHTSISPHGVHITSIDVYAASVRLLETVGEPYTRGYLWYRRFRSTLRLWRFGMHPYPLRVRCAWVRVRCDKSRPEGYP